jgi:hypothetical protein
MRLYLYLEEPLILRLIFVLSHENLFLLLKNVLKTDLILLFKIIIPHRILIAIKRPFTLFIILYAFYGPATRQILMLLSLRSSD